MVLIPHAQVDGQWRAQYAWSDTPGGNGLTVRYFRRNFYIDTVPEVFLIYISADSRYKLWVNGCFVGRGPLKGTLDHYHYEVYNLHTYLHVGKNVIAVEVRWFGQDTPVSEVHSHIPSLLVQGPESADVDTPLGWRVAIDAAVTADSTPYISNALKFLGHMECVDARKLPHAWVNRDYDDATWLPAVSVGIVDIPGTWGEMHPVKSLYPRNTQALLEIDKRFTTIIRYKGSLEEQVPSSNQPLRWSLPAGEEGELVLDAGGLTTGYPVLDFTMGEGRRVTVTYSECVVSIEDRGGYRINHKAIRDDFVYGDVEGYCDTVVLPSSFYTYEPFHWRAFWYIRIYVEAGETPFQLEDVHYRFTTYPQNLRASFISSIHKSQQMWDISWRTLQLCAHETYEDCPYFEQLNYIADTRIQALCSMVLSGETDLPRRSIRLFRDSIHAVGLIESRVPSVIPQIKPYFALLWILMVDDYWRWTGNRSFTRTNLNVVDSILWYFRESVEENGFVGKLPYWHMVDRISGWPGGTPPAVTAGCSTYMTSLYILALDTAIQLHTEAGHPQDAQRWLSQRDKMREHVRFAAWDEKAGLFLEGPGRKKDGFSQHSQVMAILAGVADAGQQKRILRRLTTDSSLHRMKFMQSFYLARALEKAGGYAALTSHVLTLWYDALAKHVSTWPEYPDPTRSDCHAWSSWIAADFITCVLGIQPVKPGFAAIALKPHLEVTESAEGRAPTPNGTVYISWHRVNGNVSLNAKVPEGIPTYLAIPGIESIDYASGGSITYDGPYYLDGLQVA